MKGTVALAMIVRNEAGHLADCLGSVAGQVDEIVVVDTGSTDGTLEIARRYTDRVYHYPWDGDFSAARNFAIERAGSEWILSLDADEELVPGSGSLKQLVNQDERLEAYMLPLNNPTAACAAEYNRFWVLRLFKNDRRYRFRGRIHEQVVVPEGGAVGIAGGPVIRHKLLPQRERNRKRGRNLTLLKKACLDDPQNYHLHYYTGVEWLMLGRPEKALPHLQLAYRNLTDEQLLFRGPALRYLVICLKSLGRLDEAICLCLEADLRYPDYTDVYYLCGVLFEEKKEYELAVKWLGQAVKCGTPPPLYSHMNGAGSFLAFHHLGYCHEMLGRPDTARQFYERALEANPGYVYPAFNIFLNISATSGPKCALEYLKEKGYLDLPGVALAVADMLYWSGYPGLSRRCLEDCGAPPEKAEDFRFYLGKYSIYAGRLEQGLKHLGSIPEESAFFVQAQIHRAISLMLSGRFRKAGRLARQLWKKPEARCEAAVLLSLCRLAEKGGLPVLPQKIRGRELLAACREIYEQCSLFLPEETSFNGGGFYTLMDGLELVMKNLSPAGCLALLDFYRKKRGNVEDLFNCRFGSGGVRP